MVVVCRVVRESSINSIGRTLHRSLSTFSRPRRLFAIVRGVCMMCGGCEQVLFCSLISYIPSNPAADGSANKDFMSLHRHRGDLNAG